ncbi:MAG: reverse transcriptase family protein [Alphaproteobacteria bacterium]|nr:reverse transcriptase family protein [Alphaproteobacteria bacterium]
MKSNRHLVPILAFMLLDGPWTPMALKRRAVRILGRRSRTRAIELVEEILASIKTPYAPQFKQLERAIVSCSSLHKIGEATADRLGKLSVTVPPPRFAPLAPFRGAGLPGFTTTAALAHWLAVPLGQIEWLADSKHTLSHATSDVLHHYACHWIPKQTGSWRLIESPKPRLKAIQRRILHDILDHMPVHDSAFAFIKGRSCATAAARHAGEDVVITVDLKDFFLTTPPRRIHAIFRCLGYPTSVTRVLTGICTTATPAAVLETNADIAARNHETRKRYASPHLPQGAPTSPTLANLAARGLDCRLTGLASRFNARYTRYADDLTFSGDKALLARSNRFIRAIQEIVQDEGFALNASKTRIMPRSTRQSVTGLVVNQHINIARPDYDNLKATLTNCARHGAPSQNREGHADFRAHMDGRVAWVENVNRRRGEKLRRIFEKISW